MLEILGLQPGEEEVYVAILDQPPVTCAELQRLCPGLGRQRARNALEGLTQRGLLNKLNERPSRYAPVAPDVSIEALAMQREDQLRGVRAALGGLSQKFRAAPGQGPPDEVVEVITGRHQVRASFERAMLSARHQIRTLNRPPFDPWTRLALPAEVELLDRPLRFRSVYDRSGLRSPKVVARRRAEIAAGEEERLVGEVPVRLLLVDDRIAMLPLHQNRSMGEGTLLIRRSALLFALSALFEQVWLRAVPLRLGVADGAVVPTEADPDQTTVAVWNLLAAGFNDRGVAHQLGCTERTVQRHVQRIVRSVGAQTRLQAALLISQSGELPENGRHP